MKIGLAAIGIGAGAQPQVMSATARAAEHAGFARLWMGEHVVLFDSHDSRYPYSPDGRLPLAGPVDWLDPFVALGYAAAVTERSGLATGICLLPEHHPVILAKTAATLDHIARGRFSLGIGIGWMEEEFAARGIPFARRAERTREYVAAMRRLWSDESASFHGEFVNFDSARSFPKPARGRIPIIVGGESDAALRRAAEYGDGWYGFNLGIAEVSERIRRLREFIAARGRDISGFEIVVAPFGKPCTPGDLAGYREAGVDEIVIVESPPDETKGVDQWIDGLARRWLAPAAKLP
jgi:probable F420-dependent oxidoreductase